LAKVASRGIVSNVFFSSWRYVAPWKERT
jgi:hypothetical protein